MKQAKAITPDDVLINNVEIYIYLASPLFTPLQTWSNFAVVNITTNKKRI